MPETDTFYPHSKEETVPIRSIGQAQATFGKNAPCAIASPRYLRGKATSPRYVSGSQFAHCAEVPRLREMERLLFV